MTSRKILFLGTTGQCTYEITTVTRYKRSAQAQGNKISAWRRGSGHEVPHLGKELLSLIAAGRRKVSFLHGVIPHVLIYFLSTCHTLESSRKREPQLRKYFPKTGL